MVYPYPFSVFIADEKTQDFFCQKKSFTDLCNESYKSSQKQPPIDLDYCLEVYQKIERMDADCLVDCDRCNYKTQREIRIEVSAFPQVLMVQLKRFKTIISNKGKLKKVKIKTDVHFDKKLTLNGQNYELVSYVNHFGEINSGHYTAVGKVPEAKSDT